MTSILAAHGITFDTSASFLALTVAISALEGLVLIFLYAAARPRFGPGPRAALTIALTMWLGSYLVSIAGFGMLGIYPMSMLALWASIGLIEMCAGCLIGAWLYREG